MYECFRHFENINSLLDETYETEINEMRQLLIFLSLFSPFDCFLVTYKYVNNDLLK